jgi:hypothetical protein
MRLSTWTWTVSCPGTTRTGTTGFGREVCQAEAIAERRRMAKQYEMRPGNCARVTGPLGGSLTLRTNARRSGETWKRD